MNARLPEVSTPPARGQADEGLAIAPMAVVRAAAWPLASITALVIDDDELDHRTRVELERQRLWAATAGDPAFMRALSLSNPELAESVEQVYAELGTRPRNKALRHYETTLYRTLARAAGRPAPCDLWAGTVLAPFAQCTVVEPRPRCVHIAPDLRPFAAILGALRSQPRHREGGRFKLNPTLAVDETIAWWHRSADGFVSRRELGRTAVLVRVIEVVGDRGVGPFCAHVEGLLALGLDREAARCLAADLVEHGLLVGGLGLPSRFRCPWDALDAVVKELDAEAAPIWTHALARLRSIAKTARARIDDDDPGAPPALRALQRSATRCVEELAMRLGVANPPRLRAPLRCDASIPAAITLGPEIRDRLRTSIRRYLPFQARFGVGWDLYEAAVQTLGATPVGLAHLRPVPRYRGAPVWESLLAALGTSARAPARARAWTRLLAGRGPVAADPGTATLPIGFPVSLYSVGLRADPEQAAGFAVRGSIDAVTVQYARHTPLWSEPGDPLDPLGAWIATRLREVGRRCGVAPVVLVGPSAGNPNALAQPDLGFHTIEVWGTTTDAVSLLGARLVVDPAAGIPFLRGADGVRHAAVTVTSASLEAADPVSRALMLTGQLGSPVTDMPAHTVPFEVELQRDDPSPRVDLGDDVVRTRRTVIAGDRLRALVRPRDAAGRFAKWCELARDLDWPALVLVRRRGRALLVPRNSAIAVGAALEGAGNDPFIVVEDFEDHAWLPGPDGRRHVAEIGIPFVRPRHAWQALGGQREAG